MIVWLCYSRVKRNWLICIFLIKQRRNNTGMRRAILLVLFIFALSYSVGARSIALVLQVCQGLTRSLADALPPFPFRFSWFIFFCLSCNALTFPHEEHSAIGFVPVNYGLEFRTRRCKASRNIVSNFCGRPSTVSLENGFPHLLRCAQVELCAGGWQPFGWKCST